MNSLKKLVLTVSALTFNGIAADIRTEVCVVGGGSGGVAAALAAAREGAEVVLVEKLPVLGGTSTAGLVSLWGGTPGDTTACEIYDALKLKGAAGVTRRFGKVPYHCWSIDPALAYESTTKAQANRVSFDPDAFSDTVLDLLQSHGVRILLNTEFRTAEAGEGRVRAVRAVSIDGTETRIEAKVFIDATGDVYLCRSAGCETVIGESLNGVTLCYRVRKGGNEPEEVIAAKPFKRTSCNHQLPNGDRIINMLPTLAGGEFLRLGYDAALEKCQKLVRRHWAWLRQGPGEWKDYRFVEEARLLGIREGHRVVGEYVLNATDLSTGIQQQPHSDMIALASHGVDVHGPKKGIKRVQVKPYGIPYRCLIPRGWKNLLVACRGASFDRVAASSVRLSRTMIWIGHAAGIGAAKAAKADVAVADVDVTTIVKQVGMDRDSVQRLLGNASRAANADKRAPTGSKRAVVQGTARHAFLCTDNGLGKILKFDADGRCVWEYPAPRCQDVWALPNGNVLFTTYNKTGSGVREVTPEKKVVFEFNAKGEIHACQRLANGNTVLGECGACRVLEVTPEGNIVRDIPVISKFKNPHYHMRQVRMTGAGTVLVCHPKEFLVREYNLDGSVLRTIKNVGGPFTAIRLSNGNTLIAGGGSGLVTEVDAKGNIVWQLTPADVPEVNLKWVAGLQRLANGNTIVCNWLGHGQYGKGVPLFEVTPDKKVVWMFTDNQTTRSISSVCLLDAPEGSRR